MVEIKVKNVILDIVYVSCKIVIYPIGYIHKLIYYMQNVIIYTYPSV